MFLENQFGISNNHIYANAQAARKSPGQQLHAYSFSLYTAVDSAVALTAACAPHDGNAPDAVFTCAGAAHPMYFVEMTEEELRRGMDDAYWVQAWTIFVCFSLNFSLLPLTQHIH